MKNTELFLFIVLSLIAVNTSSTILADQPVISGISESSIKAGDTCYTGYSWMAEQFANIRMRADLNDRGVIHAAVNASASSNKDEKTTTNIEIERLYMSIYSEKSDISAGFMRIPFGYGQAFKPSDFINPRNPLYPEARLKGVLGANAQFYHIQDIKIQLFAADRSDSAQYIEENSIVAGGASLDYHNPLFSVQTLYAIQQPVEHSSNSPVHFAGLSLKFDAIAGFAIDTLYAHDGEDSGEPDGLKAAFGIDYSLLKGKLYLLMQYFYNGTSSLKSSDKLDKLYGSDEWYKLSPYDRIPANGFHEYYRRHYLLLNGVYNLSDYTSISAIIVANIEDYSFIPSIRTEHQPFQGLTLGLTFRIPVDLYVINGGSKGELGPHHAGYKNQLLIDASMRF
ncbi:MAG: hypothetical protein JXK07_03695 [Spirochaetes bacterium]|nr:hypothetical protein [Spirochaetota bacterium]MBN2769391.1 hypothetical protein [Spirochaetota bacterium]